MNILFFSRLFYPHIGGVEKHVEELSKTLIKKGHSVTIITERLPDFPTKPKEIYQKIKIYRIPQSLESNQKKLKTWQWLWQHRKLIKHADIIHIHDVFYWYLPFRILYPQKPVYTTFHGYESYPLPKNAKTMHKISEQLSWGNICIGDFIPKWYGTKATIVSYGATDIPKKHQKPNDSNSAIFIGRLDNQTSILDYAKTAQKIKLKIPDFTLTIVGDGPLKEILEKKGYIDSRLRGNDNIKGNQLKGFQKNPEKYLQENKLAFVSRYLAILEAFAYKRMVFALYDSPIKEDYLKLAPFAKNIVIEHKPDKLAKKVLYYMQHPEEENELIEANYKWVKKQTWENLAEEYLKLWGKSKI